MLVKVCVSESCICGDDDEKEEEDALLIKLYCNNVMEIFTRNTGCYTPFILAPAVSRFPLGTFGSLFPM